MRRSSGWRQETTVFFNVFHMMCLAVGSLFDPRFGLKPFGPFPTFEDFAENFWYFHLSELTKDQSVQECLDRFFAKDHHLVFTHGDLATHNILVRTHGDTCNIAAILDWECAGWYPDYWELTRALRSNFGATADFWERLRKLDLFVGKFEDEIELEYGLGDLVYTG
jgi:hypothetical protein